MSAKKSLLRKQNVAKRLAFAKIHLNWTNEQWSEVLFRTKVNLKYLEIGVAYSSGILKEKDTQNIAYSKP